MQDSRHGHDTDGLPDELRDLLAAGDGHEDAAWQAFVERYSRLLLHAVHRTASHYDQAMDRYAFVLERLREDDCRRLRAYSPDGGGSFATWLVVVARRLCEDLRRHRYGRPQRNGDGDEGQGNGADTHGTLFALRRRLVDMAGEELDPGRTPHPNANPEREVREAELYAALDAALQSLDERDRLMIKLRFEHELTAREIARMMALPTQFHVYRRLRSRLKTLRRLLEEMGFKEPWA